jgi:anti-anti-sigma factor
VVNVDGHAVVVARGEIDPATAGHFSASVSAALAQAPRVVIDLSGVAFMDSSGVRVIIETFQRTGQNREALALRAPSAFIRRLLAVTGLDQAIDIEDDPTNVSQSPQS